MRYAWIEQHRDDYAVSRMCRLLAVSRTGYLQWLSAMAATPAERSRAGQCTLGCAGGGAARGQ